MLVIEGFLDPGEIQDYRRGLECARWQSGLATAGELSAPVKRNAQTDPGCATARRLADRLLGRMGRHATLVSACLPHRIHLPVFNRYAEGDAYGDHVDAAVMPMGMRGEVLRSDISMTLFLSAPDASDGGELVIEGDWGTQEVKPGAGDMVLYPSGTLHRVNPVRRGERLAAVTWIQSLVPDAATRSLLFDLDRSIQSLTRTGKTDSAELLRLSAIYNNLVRHFAQV